MPMTNFLWPLKKSFQKTVQHWGDIWSADDSKKHTGIDVLVPPGEAVFAVAPGTITRIGSLDNTGKWARYAVLEHTDKAYCTSYLHIEPQVSVGQKLNTGDIVGKIANIKGPHFHFNVWKGPKNEKLTQRGALPVKFKIGGDPEFPQNFVDPLGFTYSFINSTETRKPAPPLLFTRDLFVGCMGQDVLLLQKFLNTDSETQIAKTGDGSPGYETENFGSLTEKALKRFQVKYGLAADGDPRFGIMGPKTRAKFQELFGVSN